MNSCAAKRHWNLRATALGNLTDPATTGSIGGRPHQTGQRLDRPNRHGPIAADNRASAQRSTAWKLRSIASSGGNPSRSAQLENRYEGKARRIRGVLDQLGVKADAASPATGGPFVPVMLPPANEGFERALFRVNMARSEADQLSDTLRTVPVRQPVTGEIDETSPFGVRMDPFLHEPAMHTGIDIRGEIGEPVHATAAGRVTIAGWDGGYGNMVEIDHGNGLSTRYGHLSEIDVACRRRSSRPAR